MAPKPRTSSVGALVRRRTSLQLREQLLRVLDRVALRELVGLAEDLRRPRRRARPCDEVEPPSRPMTRAHDLARLELRRRRTSGSCRARGTRRARRSSFDERRARGLAEARLAAVGDVLDEARRCPRRAPTLAASCEAVDARRRAPRSTARSRGRRSSSSIGTSFG